LEPRHHLLGLLFELRHHLLGLLKATVQLLHGRLEMADLGLESFLYLPWHRAVRAQVPTVSNADGHHTVTVGEGDQHVALDHHVL
jgi:hypothetical protein